MRKFILTVSKCEKEENVSIHSNTQESPPYSCLYRQSPIYAVSDTPIPLNLKPEEETYILFCFTFKSFKTIGRLLRLFSDQKISDRVFITHGIASVVIIPPDYESIKEFLSSIDELIIGHEIWVIKNGLLTRKENNLEAKHVEMINSNFNLNVDELPIDCQNIFNSLIISLNQVYSISSVYANEYLFLFDNVYKLSQELVLKLLFLKDKITEKDFESLLKKNNPQWDDEDLKKQLMNNVKAKNDNKERIIRIHQLKDESIQLSAIIQNILRQGLGSISPILSSTYEAGEHSLLGIGGVFSAIVAINTHIRKAFSVCSDVESIAEFFKQQPSPPLPDPSNLAVWRDKLYDFNGITKAIPFCKPKEQSTHLVYFSNRLGFRETKHSIATAIQSVTLASLPSWNMCTIFHEYMHAHVRALFSQIYPFNSVNSVKNFDNAFSKYENRSRHSGSCDNLFEFLQASFMSAVSDLAESTIVSESISKHKVENAISEWHHSINEIIVHIIDYSYFYEFRNDTYVKGIWSSWVRLPFIYSRISEYLLRTICAVASNESGTEEYVFKRSVDIVRTNLEYLKKYQSVDNLLLQEIIDHLENTSAIEIQFYHLYPLIYIVKHFIIASQLKEAFVDPDAAFVNDSYSIELPPGIFEDRSIRSPITFLQEYLRNLFQSEEFPKSRSEVEYITLWLFSVVSSSLTGEEE